MTLSEEVTAPVGASAHAPLGQRDVLRTWWPLAASWVLMGLEMPLVSAAIARLPDARVSLAMLGGIVFPLALLIESPVIMLLSASTALARDRASLRFLNRVMLVLGGGFTALHALVAFTPLYDLIAGGLLGVPPEVREPGRLHARHDERGRRPVARGGHHEAGEPFVGGRVGPDQVPQVRAGGDEQQLDVEVGGDLARTADAVGVLVGQPGCHAPKGIRASSAP